MEARRIAALRGALLLIGTIIIFSLLLHHLLIPLLGITVAVRNDADPFSLSWLLGMIALSAAVLLLAPRPALVWTIGLLLGGAFANAVDRHLFGPVADYILVPGSGDLYCNLPDLFIFVAPTLLVLMVIRNGLDVLLPPAFTRGSHQASASNCAE